MSRTRVHRLNRDRLASGLSVVIVTDYHCRHVGEFERLARCRCPSKQVPAFECSRHGLCTIQRQSSERDIPWCETCPDFEARSATI